MKRKLKALALGLFAALAMSAMAAPAAHATEEGHFVAENPLTGEHEEALVHGEDIDLLEFTAPNGDPVVCSDNEFEGTFEGTTKTLTLIRININPCTAAGQPMTIDRNGCHYGFYTARTVPGDPDSWEASAEIVCPAGSPGIQATVMSGSGHSFRVCTVTFPPQTGMEGITFHNLANGHLEVTFNIINDLTQTKSGLCGHEHGNASFHGTVTLTGENHSGEPLNLRIEHTDFESTG